MSNFIPHHTIVTNSIDEAVDFINPCYYTRPQVDKIYFKTLKHKSVKIKGGTIINNVYGTGFKYTATKG